MFRPPVRSDNPNPPADDRLQVIAAFAWRTDQQARHVKSTPFVVLLKHLYPRSQNTFIVWTPRQELAIGKRSHSATIQPYPNILIPWTHAAIADVEGHYDRFGVSGHRLDLSKTPSRVRTSGTIRSYIPGKLDSL